MYIETFDIVFYLHVSYTLICFVKKTTLNAMKTYLTLLYLWSVYILNSYWGDICGEIMMTYL